MSRAGPGGVTYMLAPWLADQTVPCAYSVNGQSVVYCAMTSSTNTSRVYILHLANGLDVSTTPFPRS